MKKVKLILIMLLCLSGCTNSKTKQTIKVPIRLEPSAPSITQTKPIIADPNAETYLSSETVTPISDDYPDIKTLDFEGRHVLGNATISKDGKIPVTEIGDKTIKLLLLDLQAETYQQIDEKPWDVSFGVAYQDEDIFVFFDYKMHWNLTIPNDYYIYDKAKSELTPIGISEYMYENDKDRGLANNDVTRIGNELYFEIPDRNMQKKDNIFIDHGISIYKYNLESQQTTFVVAGTSPQNVKGHLYYLRSEEDEQTTLIDYQTSEEIATDINGYAWNGKHLLCERLTYDKREAFLIENGEEQLLFDVDWAWDYKMNDKYITWQQSGDNLYAYDLDKKAFVLLAGAGGGGFSIASDKYIYWLDIIQNPTIKEDVQSTLVYAKL